MSRIGQESKRARQNSPDDLYGHVQHHEPERGRKGPSMASCAGTDVLCVVMRHLDVPSSRPE